MAGRHSQLTDLQQNNSHENLPDVVAGMEMLTVDNNDMDTTKRYSMRKRIPKKVSKEILNRRCSLKPKKRSYSELETEGEIRDYYLDRSLKKIPCTTLETIFEEVDGMNENSSSISARKFKRLIKFNGDSKTIDAKIKKRKAKIKRVFGSKMKIKTGTVTMQALLKKLNAMRSDTLNTASQSMNSVE